MNTPAPAGRRTIPLFLLAAVLMLASIDTAIAESTEDALGSFFETHCLRCHGSEKQKGNFRLDDLSTDFSDPQVAETWNEVVSRINAGEMPPEEEPQPTAEEIGRTAELITKKIRDGAASRMAKRGLVEHYRLSRQEYAHTVYDLLGVVFNVEAPGALNEDPRWHGFDRIGATLATAPSHIDRYFNAANAVVELAFPNHEPPSRTVRTSAREGHRQLLQLGEHKSFDLRTPGYYRIRIRASGLPAFTGRVPRLTLWHHQQKKSYGGVDLATTEDPETIRLEGLFPAGGYQIQNYARHDRKYRNRHEHIDASKPVASVRGGFASNKTKLVDEDGRPVMPLILFDWVEVEGPITTEADQRKQKELFPVSLQEGQVTLLSDADAKEVESLLEEARQCLHRFAERAWRRPVSDAEVERYVRFLAAELKTGVEFRPAYKSALASMLVARSFLNLEEGSPDENRKQVNDFELASRLSYFLWSSMPDEKLFAAARNGRLHTAEGLAGELNRMLADPKIDRFLDSFPRQWLQLHRVGMFQPDPNLYPEYDPWLEDSMVMETTGYFAEMFRKNLPMREAVDSNWTMLNSRLAIHYGLPTPKQAGLARAELSPESGRGGMLTHAAVLSLTSDGTRHRPVHRGAWVSEAMFAHTPPPPPPNVDPLEPVKSDQPKTTIRAQLEAHATTASCASCHAKIDPLGLAFDNFDAIGRWRETERIEGGTGEDPPVDASGILPDGRAFAGPTEFKKLIAADASRLAEAFVEQLATYALRRVMTVDDESQLHAIVASAKADDYRLRTLIRGLVTSELFRKR